MLTAATGRNVDAGVESTGMLCRGALVVVAVAAAALCAPAHAQGKGALLTFSGTGGQTAMLSVSRGPIDIAFPVFDHARLDGPDGTASGVLIQRGSAVVGGDVLLNAPGFDHALVLPLGNPEGLHISRGRYRVTMLGSTRQRLTAVVSSGESRVMALHGVPRPITRSFSSTGAPLDTWSHRLGTLKADDTLVLGLGAGGAIETHAAQSCLQHGDVAPSGPCVQGASTSFGSPGGASWSGSIQTFSSDQGPFVYSGQIEAAGVDVSAGHVAVVITPRR